MQPKTELVSLAHGSALWKNEQPNLERRAPEAKDGIESIDGSKSMTQPEAPASKGPEAVRVKVLGGFSVSVGSRTIPQDEWRSKKAAALVKLLALAPGHRMHREQAIDLLWPNSATRAASNNLRQVVYGARKVLDLASGSRESCLSLKDEQIVLCPEGQLWVDVDAFEGSATTARRSRDSATYRAAIDLYAGELLPEDRYEEWAEGRRNELRQLYLALVFELAELYEGREEHALAIEELRKATAQEPTLEEAHASLMRIYALSGRPERALAQYERLRDALQKDLGTRPTEATRRLRDEIAAGRLTMSPPAGPHPQEKQSSTGKHNLPAPRTSFVGREREMVKVKRTLAMTRLLTLTGTGGSGKTRLAIEAARDLIGSYSDGVWLVELAPLSEGSLVAQQVAHVLGVQEHFGQALVDTLAEALAGKEILLVLDNCEHLVEEAAHLADALLTLCPRFRVLATSREPLGVEGEVLWQVPPLSLPTKADRAPNVEFSLESLMRFEAVRLFVERARQRLLDFEVTQENAGTVARVCRKLDGIPLAIELAAARMGAFAVEQVAQRLEVSLDVLSGANRTAAPRQQTLRATIDWSHRLLSEAERVFFRRLSVFAGSWTLEAAEAVCSGDGVEEGDVLDLLGGLVDKSLVVAGTPAGGSVRYRMLEPLRQYAREKLEEGGEIDEVQNRHATFFLAMAEEAEPELAGPQQSAWVERLEAEHDNMREVLSWTLERGEDETALRLGAALWRFWHTRGYLSEGIRWMEPVLAEGEPAASPARVKALEGMGWILQYQGDYERAKTIYEEMFELSRESGNKGNIATALNSLGTVAAQQGDNERAKALLQENLGVIGELEAEGNPATPLKKFHVYNLLGYLAINEEDDYARGTKLWEQSLALAREIGDNHHVGITLANLGHPALLQRDFERAKALSEEARTFAHELGSAGVEIVPTACINLGLASLGLGEHERAMGSFEEALVTSQDMDRTPQVIEALEGMASLAGALGKAARAAHLWGAAEAARRATGIIAFSPGELALHEPYLGLASSQLGDEAWQEALAEGRAMSLEEAVEYALSKEADQPEATIAQEHLTSTEPMGNLTPREREVVVLVARGHTNRQVSIELSISERTAANHVAKILRKLGLRSRAQIANWVSET
jgi:predicted ATPase/DNA-binding SARP family transcriptional activator/DNA-binding CsgD family transcriptional regulator